MLKRICLLACLIFLPGLSHATIQMKDRITLLDSNGGILCRNHLQENPLWPLFSSKGIKTSRGCTANYTGYTAAWLIKDGKLYLENYYSGYKSLDRKEIEAHSRMKELFPRARGPVLAEWYTGTLHFGSGSMKKSIHLGHTDLFEFLHVYRIRNGIVESQKTYQYPASIDYYKKRDQEQADRVKKMIAEGK